MKKLLAGLASLVGLAACGQDAPYGHTEHFSSYDSTQPFFFTATSRGPLFVDVHGTYPGYENVSADINAAMERGMASRPFKATSLMEEADSPAYRVIWVIAPPKNYNANRICKGQIPASEPGEKPKFAVIFCSDDKVLRDISGWVRPEVTPDSEHFVKFVGVLTRALFK